jgi:hypothetical protein
MVTGEIGEERAEGECWGNRAATHPQEASRGLRMFL